MLKSNSSLLRSTRDGVRALATRYQGKQVTQRCVAISLLLFSTELAGCAALKGGGASNAYPAALERQQLLESLEADSPSEARATYGEMLAKADQERDQGKISEAAISYIRALGLKPGSSAPKERLAYMHLEKDPAHAQMIFEQLLERDSSSAEAYTGLGLSQLVLGEVEAARDSLERALSFGATSSEPAAALGVIHDRLGEFDVAQDYYRSALELEPGSADLLNNLGTSEMLAGDFTVAIETLGQALRRRPGDTATLNNLGLAHGRLGHYAESKAAFEQADADAAINNLGFVLAMNGDFKKAIEHYEEALISGRGDRLTILRNLHAAQLEVYGTWKPAPVVKKTAKRKKKPAKASAPVTDQHWLQ